MVQLPHAEGLPAAFLQYAARALQRLDFVPHGEFQVGHEVECPARTSPPGEERRHLEGPPGHVTEEPVHGLLRPVGESTLAEVPEPRVGLELRRERGSVHGYHLRTPVQGACRPPAGRGAQVHARLAGRRPQAEECPSLLELEPGARGRIPGAVHALPATRRPAHCLVTQNRAVHCRPGSGRTHHRHLGEGDEAVVAVLHLRRGMECGLQRARCGRETAPFLGVGAPGPEGDGAGAGEAPGQGRHRRVQRPLDAGPDAEAGAGKGRVDGRPLRGRDEACTQHLRDGMRAGELLEEVRLEAGAARPKPASEARWARRCGHVRRRCGGRDGGAPRRRPAHGLLVLHPCTPTVSRVALACARGFAL
jgi:hypothetical protein